MTNPIIDGAFDKGYSQGKEDTLKYLLIILKVERHAYKGKELNGFDNAIETIEEYRRRLYDI